MAMDLGEDACATVAASPVLAFYSSMSAEAEQPPTALCDAFHSIKYVQYSGARRRSKQLL